MQTPDKTLRYSATFVVTKSGKAVGQLRDDKKGVINPGRVGAFGGGVKQGEDHLQAAYRELVEETNIKVAGDSLKYLLDDRILIGGKPAIRYFYYVVVDDSVIDSLEVYEGQGWEYIDGPDDPRLVRSFRPALKKLFTLL